MADLIVIGYDDMHKAEEVRLKLQREYLVDLEDAVVAVKDEQGKVKLNQIHNLTASGAISRGFGARSSASFSSILCSAWQRAQPAEPSAVR
jgi:uncharacterized membrane protein